MTPRQLPEVLDHVGPGWRPLLAQLHIALLLVHPTYQVFSVKEKFGGLRVYLVEDTSASNRLIMMAEEKSLAICENCGQPGEPRPGGWIKTLCNVCHELRTKTDKRSEPTK